MLAARLDLGEAERAVLPWLVRLEQDSTLLETPAGRRVSPDQRTRLVTMLPPIFLGSRQSAGVARDIAAGGFLNWTEGPNRRLAELYASALLIAAGEDPPEMPDDIDDPGVRLVRSIVSAQHPDADRRERGRTELRRIAGASDEPWVRAWCHAGIGLSLLEETESQRLAGVGHLLVVPSVHARSQPHLAGICLARSATALFDDGRLDEARELLGELEIQFPRHPALATPPIRAIRSVRTTTTADGTQP